MHVQVPNNIVSFPLKSLNSHSSAGSLIKGSDSTKNLFHRLSDLVYFSFPHFKNQLYYVLVQMVDDWILPQREKSADFSVVPVAFSISLQTF
jgi:hypothetical protein